MLHNMEKHISSPEAPKSPEAFEREAAVAVARQAETLKEIAETPLQQFAAQTIRLGSEDVIGKETEEKG